MTIGEPLHVRSAELNQENVLNMGEGFIQTLRNASQAVLKAIDLGGQTDR